MCVCSFFFSSRRRHTRSLCDWSSDVCSSDLEPRFEDARLGDVRRSVLDVSLAERKLGWRPEVGLEEGLRLTWQSLHARSEERRVGKECTSRGAAEQYKKKTTL